jgi:hypothetical protein
MVWTIRSTGNKQLLVKPYKKGPEELGIFATRSPLRPNPILLSAAQMLDLDVEKGVVQLAYLDAEEGSPILDIKPYLPATERIRDANCPCNGAPIGLDFTRILRPLTGRGSLRTPNSFLLLSTHSMGNSSEQFQQIKALEALVSQSFLSFKNGVSAGKKDQK